MHGANEPGTTLHTAPSPSPSRESAARYSTPGGLSPFDLRANISLTHIDHQ
jgi:hypothetical protein